ncbi:response regulator [candidate division CSSED10-310 bacterium]|uniref:Response regulator n=1 Tax=candidate division CSSED10-310 bacterium TaxID=2855610 RepID=A0ABV6YTM0_UNCC1
MKPYKILIVDDDRFVLNLMDDILTANGYDVLTASSGKAALEILKMIQPDLIISDITMPEMHGFQLLEKIQTSADTKQIPFIFLSSKDQTQDRVEGLDKGADDYICKPFNEAELLARIRLRLRKKPNLDDLDLDATKQIQGDLSIISIVDLIQILKLRKITGEIEVTLHDDIAIIRLNEGELADIRYRNFTGFRAFQRLLDQKQGHFSLTCSEQHYDSTIQMESQEFMLECTKQLDELKDLATHLPALQKIFTIARNDDLSTVPLSILNVLILFDGQNSLQDILDMNTLTEVETLQIVRELIQNELIKERETLSHGSDSVGISPDQERNRDLIMMLKHLISHQEGKTSLLVVGERDDMITAFINQLRQCLDADEDPLEPISKIFRYKRLVLDLDTSLTIYGTTKYQQLSFIQKILKTEIMGLVILISETQSVQQKELLRFIIKVYQDYKVPHLILNMKHQSWLNGSPDRSNKEIRALCSILQTWIVNTF